MNKTQPFQLESFINDLQELTKQEQSAQSAHEFLNTQQSKWSILAQADIYSHHIAQLVIAGKTSALDFRPATDLDGCEGFSFCVHSDDVKELGIEVLNDFELDDNYWNLFTDEHQIDAAHDYLKRVAQQRRVELKAMMSNEAWELLNSIESLERFVRFDLDGFDI